MNMVTVICSIISTLVVIFFFVHNIILQVKVRKMEERVNNWHYNESWAAFQSCKAGKITEEEMNERIKLANYYQEYIMYGKA